MSVRIQVILDQKEVTKFKSQALKESKSLSAWLRDAGKKILELNDRTKPLTDPSSLKSFFNRCKEKGQEPEWEDLKKVILEGHRKGFKL
jgi:hypothetical protein